MYSHMCMKISLFYSGLQPSLEQRKKVLYTRYLVNFCLSQFVIYIVEEFLHHSMSVFLSLIHKFHTFDIHKTNVKLNNYFATERGFVYDWKTVFEI